MQTPTYQVTSTLWKWSGKDAWHFCTLPKKVSAEIRTLFGYGRPGFGSVRVRATIGKTTWETSIFPSTKDQAYLLPVKALVRKTEELETGAAVKFTIELRDV